MKIYILLLTLFVFCGSVLAQNEIAIGDSVLCDEGDAPKRYRVVALPDSPILTGDKDFTIQATAPFVHVMATPFTVYWLGPGYVYTPTVNSDNPLLLLVANAEDLSTTERTAGYVIYRSEDDAPRLDIPLTDLTKLENNQME